MTSLAVKVEQSQKTTTMEIQEESSTSAHFSAVSDHRKMMAMPALKILADLDHSEKSFVILMSVMDRCCREPNNQGVFLGCGNNEKDHSLAFGKIYISVNVLCWFLSKLTSVCFAAYTKWFLGRFAIIFTRNSYMKAFNPFIELNVKILNLFRDKEPAQFTAIVNEYANLLKELVGIVSKQSNEEVCNRSFKLHSFVLKEPVTLAADCLLKMDGLQLNSLLECSLLQNSITKVFFYKFKFG